MSAIIPAILPTSYQDLDEKLSRLVGVADEVQIDLVDGRFVSPPSWPYAEGKDFASAFTEDVFPHLGEFKFEMDLMVEDPASVTRRLVDAGATRIIAHAESTRFLPHFIREMKRRYGHDKGFAPDLLSFGLAINTASDLALIDPYIEDIDFVQFMGIRRIGKQGEPFDRGVLAKMRAFHKKYPEMPIQVDGGVSLTTAPYLLEAGASRLIVGSDLWRSSNLSEEYGKLADVALSHGRYI